jgi:AAA domain
MAQMIQITPAIEEVTGVNLNSRGTKTLLLGPPGSGKTTSLVTFIEAGLDLFVIGTDPGFEESLLDAMERRKLPLEKLHYNYVAPASNSWEILKDQARKIGMMSYDNLSQLKSASKTEFTQFLELLNALADFKDQRTGERFGPVDYFPEHYALAIDSLSGINVMAMDMMQGAKPTAHQGEWGVAMVAEEKLILKLTSDLKCFLVITAHVDKEPDSLTGIPVMMVGALGKKLAPKLPRTFSDVILAVKEGAKFSWSTAALNVDLKSRSLPIQDNLLPDFGQIVEVWRRRNDMK